MADIDEVLDERREESVSRNWWSPEDEGEILEGYVKSTYEGKYDNLRAEIVGEDDEIKVTPSHTILVSKLEDNNVKPGDYVKIWYEGLTKTGSGQAANNYSIAVVHEDEFDDVGLEPYDGTTSEKKSEKEEETKGDEEAEEKSEETEGDIPEEAIDYFKSLMDIEEDNEMDIDEADEYLNKVREYDVDPKKVAVKAGFVPDEDKGVIKK